MYLIGNGRLFTRDSERPFIENGAILVDKNTIKEIGTLEQLKEKYPEATFLDAKQQIIMPAFINAHNHIYSAFARGISVKNYNPNSFVEILEGMWWNIDNHLTLEDTKQSAIATYLNCIENGVTTIFDHHASYAQTLGSLKTIAEVSKEFGIRSCLSYEISDRHGEEKMKEAVQENIDFYNYALADDSDMIKGMIGLHASFTLSEKTMDYIVSQVPKGAGYHVHIAEGYEDVEDCLSKYKMKPVERLNKYGILESNSLGVHCIHVSDEELDILKNNDTCMVHNPESNMGNAVGVPDSMKIFHKGILYGLGTDGYTNDMIESYKVANIIHKHEQKDPKVAWVEIPEMLFENNAKIANRHFKTPLGKIKEGYSADIIFVDYDALTPLNADNLNSHILFGMVGALVTMTMANGKVLMKDRELINLNKREILEKCSKQAADLWQRINK